MVPEKGTYIVKKGQRYGVTGALKGRKTHTIEIKWDIRERTGKNMRRGEHCMKEGIYVEKRAKL